MKTTTDLNATADHNAAVYGPTKNFNALPPNLRECPNSDFFHYIGTYGLSKSEYRQPIVVEPETGEKVFTPALHLLYFNASKTEGFAYAVEWSYDGLSKSEYRSNFWLRTYRFSECHPHNDTAVKLGNCYYQYTCSKCGRSYTVDSSD
jgi:hypothetical protein